jgi:RimJ/RimL family protein N-acetyltransferase
VSHERPTAGATPSDIVHLDPADRVHATGWTPGGLRVDLVDWDEARAVRTHSEYDDWPADEERDAPPPKLGRLIVDLTDEDGATAFAGVVSWHQTHYGPNPGSHAWNIGIELAETARGHGAGTVAQRLLARWLLATTYVERIEASTDVANIAEQKSLERAGFTREGILRSAQRRADGRHDLYSYSILPGDLELPGQRG